jgi:biotin carboxyl carrier protein
MQVRRILTFAPLANLTGSEVSPGQEVLSLEDMKLWVRYHADSAERII